MPQSNKICGTAETWEQGLLGESEKHAAVTNVATQRAVEETLASHKATTKTQKNAANKTKTPPNQPH